MQLNELYELAEQNNIQIHSFDCPNSTAICLELSGRRFIGVDKAVFKSETREKRVIAHEIAHSLSNALYFASNDVITIKRMEFRALKKEIELLVPKSDLENAICEDVTVWELAERFDVPEELIKKAMWIYFKKEV